MSKTESSSSATNKFEAALRKAFFAEYTMLQDAPHVQVDKDFRAAFQAGVNYNQSLHEVEYSPKGEYKSDELPTLNGCWTSKPVLQS